MKHPNDILLEQLDNRFYSLGEWAFVEPLIRTLKFDKKQRKKMKAIKTKHNKPNSLPMARETA